MESALFPGERFPERQAVNPEDIPECPSCGGILQPWGVWHSAGGQLADCRVCRAFFGVVLLPKFRYAMVDARLGVWHASVHPLPPPVQTDAADLIAWRTHKPPPGALTTHGTFGDDPIVLVGDWCRVALRYHWGELGPNDVLDDVGFLLAFCQEDLVVEAACPLPKGGYEQENPDSDLAPGRFRLGFGISLINYLAQAYAGTCWRALETHYLEHASLWTARMDHTRGHNILAAFFIRSPLPAALDARFKDFVKAKFKFIKEME